MWSVEAVPAQLASGNAGQTEFGLGLPSGVTTSVSMLSSPYRRGLGQEALLSDPQFSRIQIVLPQLMAASMPVEGYFCSAGLEHACQTPGVRGRNNGISFTRTQ